MVSILNSGWRCLGCSTDKGHCFFFLGGGGTQQNAGGRTSNIPSDFMLKKLG